MSKKKTLDSYEVGYGKPPKNTQFQKGISGNPTGRPKKAAEFHSIFMKESESLMTIIDNGQRRRISKLEAIAKQLHNKALTGNIHAMRIYVALYPQVLEMVGAGNPKTSKGNTLGNSPTRNWRRCSMTL